MRTGRVTAARGCGLCIAHLAGGARGALRVPRSRLRRRLGTVVACIALGLAILAALDALGRAPRTPLPVGAAPSSVVLDPVTGRLYVANAKSDTVSVLDGAGAAPLASILAGTRPTAVGVDSGAGRAFAATYADSALVALDGERRAALASVAVVDGGSCRLVATVPVGPRPVGVAVDASRGRVYVAHGAQEAEEGRLRAGRVSVIDGVSGAVLAEAAAGEDPSGIAVDPRSGRAYVADARRDEVWVLQSWP